MSLFRIFCLVFALHLIPIGYVIFVSLQSPEGMMAWLLFLLLDFPLGSIYILIEPVIELNFWKYLIFLAVFFQIVGSFNWFLIVVLVRWIGRALDGRGGKPHR